jgi:hypothetical protein
MKSVIAETSGADADIKLTLDDTVDFGAFKLEARAARLN